MLWKRKVMFNLKTNIAYSIRGILYTRNVMPVLKIKGALWLVHETRKSQLWQSLPLAVMPPGAHPCKRAGSGWISFQSTSLIWFFLLQLPRTHAGWWVWRVRHLACLSTPVQKHLEIFWCLKENCVRHCTSESYTGEWLARQQCSVCVLTLTTGIKKDIWLLDPSYYVLSCQ